jgi:hypothetical protein
MGRSTTTAAGRISKLRKSRMTLNSFIDDLVLAVSAGLAAIYAAEDNPNAAVTAFCFWLFYDLLVTRK